MSLPVSCQMARPLRQQRRVRPGDRLERLTRRLSGRGHDAGHRRHAVKAVDLHSQSERPAVCGRGPRVLGEGIPGWAGASPSPFNRSPLARKLFRTCRATHSVRRTVERHDSDATRLADKELLRGKHARRS